MNKLKSAIMLILSIMVLSCSGGDDGGNGGEHESSQVYNEDGTEYKGNGVIKMGLKDDGGKKLFETNGGKVENGIVKLELPQTIPDEYLNDFSYFLDNNCEVSPRDAKMSNGAYFGLYSNTGDFIGELLNHFYISEDYRYSEHISHSYFSKAVKITNCDIVMADFHSKYDYDAKVGWNKTYGVHVYFSLEEESTRNILTKEVKWILHGN
jgi:hypothetical protein